MVARVVGTVLEVGHRTAGIQVFAGQTVKKVVELLIDSRQHTVAAVSHMSPMEQHCLSSNAPLWRSRERRSECWDKGSRPVVARVWEGHTWYWPGYRCSTFSPRACDRNIERRWKASHEDRAMFLYRSESPWGVPKADDRLTVFTHCLTIASCEFWS